MDKTDVRNWPAIVMLALAALGLADSIYLTVRHYQNQAVGCVVGVGCDAVTTSAYSVIAGVPLAVLGVLYYASLLALLITGWMIRRPRIYQLAALFTLFGFLTSLWLAYLQFFVLRALCSFCLGSAIISTLLFILGVRFLRRRN